MASNVYNSKIKNLFLIILLSILFTITAIIIQHPTQVYAGNGLSSTPNVVSVNGQDTSTDESAGYLYWAASQYRTGIMVYVIDDHGTQYGKRVLVMKESKYVYQCNDIELQTAAGTMGGNSDSSYVTIQDDTINPIYYENKWQSNGSYVIDWLTADSNMKINGEYLPNWMKCVTLATGSEALEIIKQIQDAESAWNVVVQPVSCQYIYSDDEYDTAGTDANGHDYAAGSPKPFYNSDGVPYKVCGTAKGLALKQISLHNPDTGGEWTWKVLNNALPWSLCLDHDMELAANTGGHGLATAEYYAPKNVDGRRLTNDEVYSTQANGIGYCVLEVEAAKEPIDTYWEPYGSPGDPEPTSDLTTGDSIIVKHYYTVTKIYDSDGNLTKSTYQHITDKSEKNTTNYVNIMDESDVSGYALKHWATSNNQLSVSVPPNGSEGEIKFSNTSGCALTGTSASLIESPQTYINLILVKEIVETEDTPTNDYFELTQSTLVKRVNFSQNTATDFQTHYFIWQRLAFNSKATTCDGHTHKHQISKDEYKEDTTGYSKKMYSATVTCGGQIL
jgi:hypothetical protein